MSANICRKYNEPILVNEAGNCSLCDCALDLYGNELPDEINISWHIDDVKSREGELQDDLVEPLTDNECRQVLANVKKHHDCNIGVTWETIDNEIINIKASREDTF